MNIPELIEFCFHELSSNAQFRLEHHIDEKDYPHQLLEQLLSAFMLTQQGYEELNPHELNSKYIDHLRGEIYSLQGKLTNLRNKQSELKRNYDDLQSDYEQLQHDYDVVKGQLEVYHRMKGSLEVVDTTLPI